MNSADDPRSVFRLPDDLVRAVEDLAAKYGESPRDILIAAVDHFARIPDQQRRAVIRGTAIRRRA